VIIVAIQTYQMSDIRKFGKSPEDLFREHVFPESGVTLSELWRAYSDPKIGIRKNMHENRGKGEWVADFVDTDGAKALSGDRLQLTYIQRPKKIKPAETLGTDKHAYIAEGGKRISYICPSSGCVVPADGLLRHPETGVAIATVPNGNKAIKQLAKFIETHPEQFAGFTIPKRFRNELLREYGARNFNPEKPTPGQLAEVELSMQYSPSKNTGIGGVVRFVDGNCPGPFCVNIGVCGLDSGIPDTGARLRSKEF